MRQPMQEQYKQHKLRRKPHRLPHSIHHYPVMKTRRMLRISRVARMASITVPAL